VFSSPDTMPMKRPSRSLALNGRCWQRRAEQREETIDEAMVLAPLAFTRSAISSKCRVERASRRGTIVR